MFSQKSTNILFIAGGVLALHFILREYRKREPDIHVQDQLPFGFNAVTIPPLGIFVRADQAGNKNLLDHEMVHWHQYQRMGLIPYYWKYAVGYLQHGYELHPMEQEARFNEDEYCRTHYVECVRSGKAKTVQSEKFLVV